MNKYEIAKKKKHIARQLIKTGTTSKIVNTKIKEMFGKGISPHDIAVLRKELGIKSPYNNIGIKNSCRKEKSKPITQDDVLVISGAKCTGEIETIINELAKILDNEGYIEANFDLARGNVRLIRKQEINISIGG